MKPGRRSFFVSWALIVAFGVGLARTALAIDPNVRQLVDWETWANAVSLRSSDPIPITHFEIPFELLRSEISVALEPEVRDALMFEKDGKRYLRWIINPEDTKWHLEISRWMESKGLDATPKHHFTGYFTASSSLIIEDPVTGA